MRVEKHPGAYTAKLGFNAALRAPYATGGSPAPARRLKTMPLSMHRASIPVFVRGLQVLDTLLDKAAAHEARAGLAPGALIGARLASDMQTLGQQVQRASDTSKFSAERLSGVKSPALPDTETGYGELKARIAATVAYLQTVTPEQMDGSEERGVPLKLGASGTTLNGVDYLFGFALPNFFFHLTTAHDILRNNGVRVGKLDYLGPFD
jgi:uncharacterized protein